jgi:acetylornithine/N-succinyldiaminopimelate aminotransferase
MNSEDAHIAQTYPQRGLSITHGSGAVLYDADGKEYIDCMTGIGVALLGHSHPAVVSAIKEQAEKITTCNCMFYNETRERFVKKVAEITPGNLNRMFLCNSGTESVECALKLARKHTGKTGIIAMNRGFHGRTMGALSATWKPAYRKPFEPLVPGFSHVDFGDAETLRNAVNEDTAAVLLEPVQGESGVLLPPDGYLQEVRKICTENNVLMILDEVQTFGRTGNFFAAQTFRVVPDIVCIAKGVGGGVPLGVTASTDEIFSSFGKGDHFSTFSGNPLSCAAGLATIETIQNENLLQTGAEVGEYLVSKLKEIEDPAIRNVRGIGAMAAMEMRFPVGKILKTCQERGLIIHVSGKNIMRFLTPLVMTREQVDKVVGILQEVLDENSGA